MGSSGRRELDSGSEGSRPLTELRSPPVELESLQGLIMRALLLCVAKRQSSDSDLDWPSEGLVPSRDA